MPSSPNYVRDYAQERKTAKKRKETGVGSESGDAKRHRARRKYEKKNGKLPPGKELDHKKPLAKGGSNESSNVRPRDKSENRSAGGKIGNRKGKAAGGKKGKK